MEIIRAKYLKDNITGKSTTVYIPKNDPDTGAGIFVPMSEENRDYRQILAWVAEGNTIEPADEE